MNHYTEESSGKYSRILDLYNRLLAGEVLNKNSLAIEYGVNPRSIQRDIDDIREFFSNRMISGSDLTEIRYDRSAKGYRLVNLKTTTLTNAELFAVTKILFESRALNKDEMKRLVNKLVDACLPPGERKKMRELTGNELFHYVEPRHQKPLIEAVWELGGAVYCHKLVHLEYQKTNGIITHAVVKPVGIMCSEYYFYLIAYIGERDKKYPGYPTVYRIDRIREFKVTEETFAIPYKDRFEEGEFRKRIPFMYTGKLHKTSFTYHGPDINAVLDRLPTAVAKQQEDGSFLVTAEVYGEKGLEMWMKGQEWVEK